MKMYNQPPIRLKSKHEPWFKEMLYYQYLPICIVPESKVLEIVLPERLEFLRQMCGYVMQDFKLGLLISDSIRNYYMYLTVKHMFVSPGTNLNRLGWHSDGFGTDDVSYLWSNCLPTLWTDERPYPPDDDSKALDYFNAIDSINAYPLEANRIYRMDQYVVHACAVAEKPVLRAFVKINFSKDKYDLQGNSHNYLLNYDWIMKPRKEQRNHPQSTMT